MNSGIVTKKEYEKAVKQSAFKELEDFSNKYLTKTNNILKEYNKRWVSDPLHQWSRQWEYLFVSNKLNQFINKTNRRNIKVLDLGSGITFLPFFIETKFPNAQVTCCDYDKSLEKEFAKVSGLYGNKIKLETGDLRSLPFRENSFDVIYSVSVLEHTDNYELALKEVSRILKPGGVFILTFDISLDGLDDIPVDKAKNLLNLLKREFKNKEQEAELEEQINNSEIVTSKYISKKNSNLMPWKYPLLNIVKPLLKHKKFGAKYKNLTFYCGQFFSKD